MHLLNSCCLKKVGEKYSCPFCRNSSIKYGKNKSGRQRYHCYRCRKTFLQHYIYKACQNNISNWISRLIKESCGIRSIARLLQISVNTVLKRLLKIARSVQRPIISLGKEYELDEIRTYVKRKTRLLWIVYAIRKDTREVIDFAVGRRTNKTLKLVTDTLILSEAKKVYTDKLQNYDWLLPKEIHSTKYHGTNHIERKNLSLRTHLKRLNRKTICFTRSIAVLAACLKIYFWS